MASQSLPEKLEAALGHRFKDPSILLLALTHSSADGAENNERLEFLGDSALGLVVAEILLDRFPAATAGQLTKMKSSVVNRAFQAKLAEELNLIEYASLGGGFSNQKKTTLSVLSNLMEAILGAMCLDGGLEAIRRFAARHLVERMDEEFHHFAARDSKSRLQELAQERWGATPVYEIVEEQGPDHKKKFHAVAVISGRRCESGWGSSKRSAERRAAERTLAALAAESEDTSAASGD